MPHLHSLLLLSFFGLVSLQPCNGEDLKDATKEANAFKETVRRHFASVGGYQEGDLISRSQLHNLQIYLRKTQGHSAATHPKILSRTLSDESRLVRLFYMKNGADTLRAVAIKSGGFKILDNLTRISAKYSQVVNAVESGDIETLNQLADQESKKRLVTKEEKSGVSTSRSKPSRIYTVEDYLTAVTNATKKRS